MPTNKTQKQHYDLSGVPVTITRQDRVLFQALTMQDCKRPAWYVAKTNLNIADPDGITVTIGGTTYGIEYAGESKGGFDHWRGKSVFTTASGVIANTWCNLTRLRHTVYGLQVSCEGKGIEGAL
jgi:hypothetical protein